MHRAADVLPRHVPHHQHHQREDERRGGGHRVERRVVAEGVTIAALDVAGRVLRAVLGLLLLLLGRHPSWDARRGVDGRRGVMNLARGAVWRAEEERAARGGGRRGERDARGREEERRSVIMLRSDRQAVPSRERFHRHYKNVTQNAYRSFGPNEKVQTDYQHIRARPARIRLGAREASLARAQKTTNAREEYPISRALHTPRAPPRPPPRVRMQGWDAVNAALNPFNLARRPTVPTSRGRGRQIVFAVDASSYRWCFFFPLVSTEGDARARPDPHLPPPRLLLRHGLLRPEPHLPAPSRPPSPPFIASTRFASGSTTSRAPTTRARSRARTAKPPPRRSPSPARS